MRMFLAIGIVALALPAVVRAQDTQSLWKARGMPVNVIDGDSREWQGRLLEIAKDAIVVEVESTPQRFELSSIKRVDADGDRVIDGAIKGAVFGAVISLAVLGPRHMVPAAATYGLIGLGMDAMNRCRQTVYRTPPTQATVKISW